MEKDVVINGYSYPKVPKKIVKTLLCRDDIISLINDTPENFLKEKWGVSSLKKNRIEQWIDINSKNWECSYKGSISIFEKVFLSEKVLTFDESNNELYVFSK